MTDLSVNHLHVVCGVCGEATGDYTKVASEVTVQSGKLRIRTWLCDECAAKAECVEDANPWLKHHADKKEPGHD